MICNFDMVPEVPPAKRLPAYMAALGQFVKKALDMLLGLINLSIHIRQ
jgi:hypothetical protein